MARAGNKGHRHCPEPNCEVCRATRLRYKKVADLNEKEQLEEWEEGLINGWFPKPKGVIG